jgi:hypothetical protein
MKIEGAVLGELNDPIWDIQLNIIINNSYLQPIVPFCEGVFMTYRM